MTNCSKQEGVFFKYDKEEDLLYKQIHSSNPKDQLHVKIYNKGRYAAYARIWFDSEMYGREYVIINNTVIYLDTIKTLVSIPYLIQHVCENYDITYDLITESTLKQEYAEPRNILYYILRNVYELTLQAVATELKRKSHATVVSGIKRVQGFMDLNEDYRAKINSLILTRIGESTLQIQ